MTRAESKTEGSWISFVQVLPSAEDSAAGTGVGVGIAAEATG